MTSIITFKAQYILTPAAKKRTFWRFFKPQLQVHILTPCKLSVQCTLLCKLCTAHCAHILTPPAKKRTFWRFFKPQLQVQVTAKRYDQYYNFQGSIYINPCSLLAIFKPQLQVQLTTKRPDQYDHF